MTSTQRIRQATTHAENARNTNVTDRGFGELPNASVDAQLATAYATLAVAEAIQELTKILREQHAEPAEQLDPTIYGIQHNPRIGRWQVLDMKSSAVISSYDTEDEAKAAVDGWLHPSHTEPANAHNYFESTGPTLEDCLVCQKTEEEI